MYKGVYNMNVLKDEKGLKKKDDNTFVWSSEFVAELSEEEACKNAKHLKDDIERARQDYKEQSPDIVVKEHETKLDNEKETLEQAYHDYDNYLSEKIRELKRNKHDDKKKIKQTLDNFDEYKERRLGELRQQSENLQEQIQRLLKDREDSLQYYTQYFDVEVDNELEEEKK